MNTEFTQRTLNFGPTSISLEVFADGDREFDRHFTREASAPEPPLYGCLWPSAEGLAQYLWNRHEGIARERVLEIGCGLGLPSLVCARLGAEVLAMDHHPDFAQLFARNRDRNALRADARVGSFTDPGLDLGKFSLIIGSDILYDPSSYEALEAFIFRHARARGCELILADPGRFAAAQFGRRFAQPGRLEVSQQRVAGHPHPIEIRHFFGLNQSLRVQGLAG